MPGGKLSCRQVLCRIVLMSLFGTMSWGQAQSGEGWTRLFNGTSLDGWTVKARPADLAKQYWKVENGTIVCDSRGRSDHDYVWLMYTAREFDDFELRLKVRGYRESNGNSGVQVRSRYDEEAFWLDGPQIDIHPPDPWRTGFIYDETRGTRRWVLPSLPGSVMERSQGAKEVRWQYSGEGDGWNDIHIKCSGLRIDTSLNGIPVARFDGAGILDDEGHKLRNVGRKGFTALQLHIKDDLLVAFKDIEIRPLK
jgi:hypothetical protein